MTKNQPNTRALIVPLGQWETTHLEDQIIEVLHRQASSIHPADLMCPARQLDSDTSDPTRPHDPEA